MLAPIVLGDPRAFPAKWASVRLERTRQREKLKPPFRRWRNRSGGPTSPALRHLRELEIENHRLRTLVTERSDRQPCLELEDPLANESQFLRQDFWLRRRFAVEIFRAIARNIPWPVWIRSPYALTLAAYAPGPISTAIVRCLPASPGSCQRVKEPQ
jgi:hypothetical protein